MNENEQVTPVVVTAPSSEEIATAAKSDNLTNEITVKENGDIIPTKQVTITEQNPDVITVPPDTTGIVRDFGYDNNEHAELVVETPDGQERRFIIAHPVNAYNIRKILHHICRSVGINETMDAIIPDFLDAQSDDPKSEEMDNQEPVLQTNGVTSSEKEDCHAYILTKRSMCPQCGCISQDNKCHKCRRKLSTTVHIISPGKSTGSELILKKKSDLKDGDLKKRRCQRKHKKIEEPVCLTISSDEEEVGNDKNHSSQNGVGAEENVIVTEVRRKEPNITEDTESPEEAITRGVAGGGMDFTELLDCPDLEKALIQCRTIRIGSYKVVPEEKVLVSEYGIKIKVPTPKGESVTIKILKNEIVKVLAHFGKSMPVLFYYTTNRAGMKVRNILKMPPKVDSIYFDPTSKVEMHKRIILFPDKLTDETRLFIKSVYDSQCLLEDLNEQEADEILLRAKPKDLTQQSKKDNLQQNTSSMTPTNIQTIMVYPPPPTKGGISINTEDYACLGEDQFLNDVIIDFYLKYIVQTSLSEFDQKRTHVFSSFFYKRLTTKSSPHGGGNKYQDDPKLNAAEKRHARVKGWTKSVDLFSKDFIIIPINENSHWFLGIICFPGLTTAVRMADNMPVSNPTRRKPKGDMTVLSGGQVPATIGTTTITKVQRVVAESTITLEADDEDRDEADGNDEDLEPNTSDEESNKDASEELLDEATHKIPKTAKAIDQGEPIKQPCILIFDSLAGASRSRVCATLREYLEVEYKVRHRGSKRDFSKDTIRGAVPKVPQQTNYTDCGLYVLQYVETFFQKPITNYRMPIKQLKDWFTPELVSRKRYEIQQLLHRLMEEQNVDIAGLNLPNLGLHPDGTSSNLPYSEGEEEYEEEEEGEMGGELDETLEEEMDEEMDVEMPGGEEHSGEDEIGRNCSIRERTNEFFGDKPNFTYRHIDTSTLPCKIEPITTSEITIKRKLSTSLKDLRSPRAPTSRHSQIPDTKKMRCD